MQSAHFRKKAISSWLKFPQDSLDQEVPAPRTSDIIDEDLKRLMPQVIYLPVIVFSAMAIILHVHHN